MTKKVLHCLEVTLLFAALVFSFVSCKNNDDDEDTTSAEKPAVTLPESKGENIFKGKVWTRTTSNSSRTYTYTFADDTVTYRRDNSDGSWNIRTYNYSYNADSSLLYLSYKAFENSKGLSYSSVSEYEAKQKEKGITGDTLADYVAYTKAEFDTKIIYKYVLSGNEISFFDYFDGTLPTYAYFSADTIEKDGKEYGLYNMNGYILIDDNASYGTNEQITFELYPTFSNGSFSGKLYKCIYNTETEDETSVYLGSASGTYTVTGTGTGSEENAGTLKLNFTTLPTSFTILSANTDYVLTQGNSSNGTYTLKQ